MDNHDHALSALPVALIVAPLLGLHSPPDIAMLAVTMSGWATGPDIDCAGSDPTHLFGPVGRGLSRIIRAYSAWLYHHTGGNPRSAGTHRCATHTPIHCILLGLTAIITTTRPGEFGAIAATVWLVVGVGLALISMHRLAAIVLVAGLAAWLIGTPLSGHNIITTVAGHAPWIGYAVGLGVLVHLAGDALTTAGIPALGPFTWRDYGFLPRPLRFTSCGGFEHIVVRTVLIAATLLLIPGVWPLAVALFHNAQGSVQ